jgi:endonuclease YncB( thermonuclease family)
MRRLHLSLRLVMIGVATAIVMVLGSAALAYIVLGPKSSADRYHVIDGDTFEMIPRHCFFSRLGLGCPAQRLRLNGVDAFERLQTCRDAQGAVWPCGAVATERLRQLVHRPDFSCDTDPEFLDRHAREFSFCTAGGQDVGAILVSEGLAFAYGRGVQYQPLEREARKARRGAWAGTFVRPQYFRAGAKD